MPWVEEFRRRLMSRRHTALLVAIVTAFGMRPLIGDAEAARYIYSIAVLFLMVMALYTVQVDELVGNRERLLAARYQRRIIGWTLAVVAIIGRLATMVSANIHVYQISSISWTLFFAFVTWTELRGVLKQKEITSETISLAISVYLLFGLTWGMLYSAIFGFHPDAFSSGGAPLQAADPQHLIPVFVYFSFTILSTVGFGDITPMNLSARYAAVAEGITGQFYLAILVAILVARLVGLQLSRDEERARERGETAERIL
jgi:hypothetical protein